MPTIAQKLCDDIVEPIYTSKSTNKLKTDEQFISKTSILTKKIRIIGKNELSNIEESDKSSHTKCFISSGVNTLISGSLRSDNKCLTNVRARDNQLVCKKCGYRKKIEMIDKACTQLVESVSCGTQYLDKSRSLPRSTLNVPIQKYDNYKIKEVMPFEKETDDKVSHTLYPHVFGEFKPEVTNVYKPRIIKYSSPKRWALTRYKSRGPDF